MTVISPANVLVSGPAIPRNEPFSCLLDISSLIVSNAIRVDNDCPRCLRVGTLLGVSAWLCFGSEDSKRDDFSSDCVSRNA